jgi:lipopolysaccharide transport system ATP-binding protein
MTDDRTIIADRVSKKFCRDLKRSMIYGIQDIGRDWLGLPVKTGYLRRSEFWALDNVSFELKRGETIGIIGRNGAGKSTLLRVLNGIYPPDKGRIEVRGRTAAMIALGAGFHPHLTGRENIFLSGTILGMSKREIQSKLDAIIDFADIGDFMDSPVASYSSGMHVRLGFAIATHAPIEILLADEVLAVGDINFKIKSWNKVGELRNNGVSTILVTHDMTALSVWCNTALLMDNGGVKYYGDVDKCIEIYLRDFVKGLDSAGGIQKEVTGNEELMIHSVNFDPALDENNNINLTVGQDFTMKIDYTALREFNNILINVTGYLPIPTDRPFLQGTNPSIGQKIDLKPGRGCLNITIKKINLNNFKLYLGVSMVIDNLATTVFRWKRIPIHVFGDSKSAGIAHFDLDYQVS